MVNSYNPYKKYGLRRVINGATCLTRLGGSIARPEVFEAMKDASKSFVQIPELQAWAGKKIAEATGAEAGTITIAFWPCEAHIPDGRGGWVLKLLPSQDVVADFPQKPPAPHKYIESQGGGTAAQKQP